MPTRLARPLLAAALLVMLTLAAPAASVGRLYTMQTRFYDVTTDLDRTTARIIAGHMDAVFVEYSRLLASFPIREDTAIRLYLFHDRETYNDFLAARDLDARNTGGIFFYKDDEGGLATWTAGQDSRRIAHVLQHEGFHQFAHLAIGDNLPIWANEGLAEYFGEGLLLRGGFALGMRPDGRLQRIRRAIGEGKYYTFDEMLGMSSDRWMTIVRAGGPRAGLLYDQAWSMMQFLVHGDDGRYAPLLERYLHMVAEGQDSKESFREVFGLTATRPFEHAWRRYMLAVEADPVSTAAERLEFLAHGIRLLHESGITPESLEDLERRLKRSRFSLTRTEHGISTVKRASDDEMFRAPASDIRGERTSFELLRPRRRGLPPGIGVSGLSVGITVVWKTGDDGTLEFDLAFD